MARVLNYCVGPTEQRMSDFDPGFSHYNGGKFCTCGGKINVNTWRKAGATPFIEQTCWKTEGYIKGKMQIGFWGQWENIWFGGEENCGPYPDKQSPPVECDQEYHSYQLHYQAFDWENHNGEYGNDGDHLKDQLLHSLHQFATWQNVGYEDAKLYGSGVSSPPGVFVEDDDWLDSVTKCGHEKQWYYAGDASDPLHEFGRSEEPGYCKDLQRKYQRCMENSVGPHENKNRNACNKKHGWVCKNGNW